MLIALYCSYGDWRARDIPREEGYGYLSQVQDSACYLENVATTVDGEKLTNRLRVRNLP